jgi:tetratricopeptide (TPR) repeat protein
MALSEIEKLERRYTENPQGLTFAPLAEVHRKNGDVARALELLRPGLALHPDYIPASIVLGRCHLDLGDLPAAEAAFTHVLGLDGENVIALKALADITERLFRFDEAERWLRTLLSVDRSNDEARDQLGRVETARRQAETASSEAVATAEVPAEATAEEVEAAQAEAQALPAPVPGSLLDAMPAWEAESGSPAAETVVPLDLEELAPAAAVAAPPPEGIELEQAVTLEEPVEPIAGLVGRDGPAGAAPPERMELDEEFAVETAEDIVLESSGGSEFQVANAAEELLATRASRQHEPALSEPVLAEPHREPEPDPSEMMPFGAQSVRVPEPEPERVLQSEAVQPVSQVAEPAWTAPVAERPRPLELDLVLTESMAELLVQQGHPGEALTIYRHLERQSAGDLRFRDRIAALEQASTAPAPAYSVEVTHGRSVQAFLRGVLASRLPAAAASPPVHAEQPRGATADPDAAPTRPAHDSLSLSSVFGEESTPSLPAVPAGGGAGAAPGGVSYDEFFGAPGGSTAPRTSRGPDPKSDDLDQFHAWLQNLKR